MKRILFLIVLNSMAIGTFAQLTPEQKLADDLKPLRELERPLQKQAMEFYKNKDEEGMNRIKPELTKCMKQIDSIENAFIIAYPDSDASLMIVKNKTRMVIPEIAEPLFLKLSPRLRESEEGKALEAKIWAVKKTMVGLPASTFVQNDVNGKAVSLASYKGSYVLIDFWASWCVPCRQENPFLKAAYEKYRDKNFSILSISVDDKPEAWKKAIAEDQLPWPQLSDLKGIKNEVAQLYGITSVPQNFLVNPQGIIVARNLRGNDLEKKLAEFIK